MTDDAQPPGPTLADRVERLFPALKGEGGDPVVKCPCCPYTTRFRANLAHHFQAQHPLQWMRRHELYQGWASPRRFTRREAAFCRRKGFLEFLEREVDGTVTDVQHARKAHSES